MRLNPLARHYRWLLLLSFLIVPGIKGPCPYGSTAFAADKAAKPDPPIREASMTVRKGDLAVVHIEVIQRKRVPFPFWLYDTARSFGIPEKKTYEKPDWQKRGTGVLIDRHGHILTSYQIAGEAVKIEVLEADGKMAAAALVGGDPETDLAVLQLQRQRPIRYAGFGKFGKVRVGEPVVTIGYGTGRNQETVYGTVTGIPEPGISSLCGRSGYLKTSIPVSPGDSGGPVFNLHKEIVGIHSVIMTRLSGYEKGGYAIPGNVAEEIADTLIAQRKLERGWLGVTVSDITPHAANALGLERAEGAVVTAVVRGGPAHSAGLETGDVITNYGGKRILNRKYFERELAQSDAGEEVTLTVIRDRKSKKLSSVVANVEETIGNPVFFIRNRLGADVRSVTSNEAKQYGLDLGQGIVVTKIDAESPMRKAGFELDDLILEVEGRPVNGLRHFMDQIINLRHGQRIVLLGLDHRTGRTGFVQLNLP